MFPIFRRKKAGFLHQYSQFRTCPEILWMWTQSSSVGSIHPWIKQIEKKGVFVGFQNWDEQFIRLKLWVRADQFFGWSKKLKFFSMPIEWIVQLLKSKIDLVDFFCPALHHQVGHPKGTRWSKRLEMVAMVMSISVKTLKRAHLWQWKYLETSFSEIMKLQGELKWELNFFFGKMKSLF